MSVNKKVAREYIKKYEEKEGKSSTLKKDSDFIKDYINASNASTGSKYDSNANVENKNVVTLGQELHKGKNIMQNRYIMQNKIKVLYSKKLADQYIKDLESHVLYKHDESGTPGYPYCVAITMYPFLIDGLTKIGGQSKAPTDLKSYCGEFINLVYSVSSQFMGAVATPEFLMYMDYFIRKDYGDDYLTILDKVVELNKKARTLEQVIENAFQQVVHSMNMPAGNRGYQTVFWNVGYFDKNYFDGVFGEFKFPDGTAPKWETLSWLQKKFMKWFNEERTKYVLTFPVETMAMLTDGHDIVDKEYADFTAEMWSEGHSFFCYLSDSPDSLSSCCRLRNSLKDGEDDEHNHTTHQFSMGTASVATGSKSVMTINLNRVIQNSAREYFEEYEGIILKEGQQVNIDEVKDKKLLYEYISNGITEITERVHKYQRAFNEIIKDFLNANMLDIYRAGFINMKKQYLTIGVNGLTDAAEFLSIDANLNDNYKEFVNMILETINISNKKDRTRDCMYNTEFVPGENLSNKNYNWDKKDGYYVSPKHVMYSSYFFNPEDTELSILDKMKLHGNDYVKYLDGGQAAHLNINEHLSFDQYRQLLRVASEYGCSYFTFNCKNTVCNDCGFISKDTLDVCPKCGSHNVDYLTRIIGYLKRVSSFNEARQVEEHMRNYNKE
jgi:ribonucleoside-triphosphate reductase